MWFSDVFLSALFSMKRQKNKEQTVARWLHLVATLLNYQTPLGRISRFYCLVIRLVLHISVGAIDSNIATSAKEVL